MIDFLQAIHSALALSNHISDLDLHQAAVDTFLRSNRRRITLAGSYSRDMISIHNSHRIINRIEILRFRYKDDSSFQTHSLSSDILIPFGSYTIRFVLHVLYIYHKKDLSISELCSSFSISPSTLYDWKRLFEAHFRSYLNALSYAFKTCNDMISIVRSIPGFPHLFYILFDVHFLRSGYRCFDLLSPCRGGSP